MNQPLPLKKENFAHPQNFKYFYSQKGKMAVDYIGRYENLNEELKYILKKLNLPVNVAFLSRENVSVRREERDYKQFYNEETKLLVENRYKEEIEIMNYKF